MSMPLHRLLSFRLISSATYLFASAAFSQISPPALEPQGDFFRGFEKLEAEAAKKHLEAKELYILQGMKKDREQAVEIWRRLALIQPKENAPGLNEIINQSALNSGEFEAARRALVSLGILSPDSLGFQTADLESVVWQSPQASFAVRIVDFNENNRFRGKGSGTIFSTDGWVLTAAHVVANLQKPGVQFADGTASEVTQIHPGPFRADLVLVKVDRRTPQPPAMATNQPSPGDPITSISFPRACLVPVRAKGNLNKKAHKEGQSHYETTLSVLPGSSGGGVFNHMGELIGVIVMGLKKDAKTDKIGTCQVVPLEEIQAMSASWKSTKPFAVEEKEDWKEKSIFWAERPTQDFEQALALLDSDPRKAISLLEEAFDEGNLRAGYLLGLLNCTTPKATDEDKKKGFKYFTESSEVMPASLTFCGLMKLNGFGTDTDVKGGIKDLRLASDRGSALASANLAWYYFSGKGVETDHKVAMVYANKAADAGQPLGITVKLLGLMFDLFSFDKSKPIPTDGNLKNTFMDTSKENLKSAKAVEFFKFCGLASKQDAPLADYLYGFCYLEGIGTGQDSEKALPLLEKSGNKGDVAAAIILGSAYFSGKYLPRDLSKSMYWSGKAAEKGKLNSKVLYAIAEIMTKSSQPGDFLSPRSLGYLEEGSAANMVQTQEMLGLVYLDGKLAPKDLGKSVSLLEKATKNGSQSAGAYLSLARVEYEAERNSAK